MPADVSLDLELPDDDVLDSPTADASQPAVNQLTIKNTAEQEEPGGDSLVLDLTNTFSAPTLDLVWNELKLV